MENEHGTEKRDHRLSGFYYICIHLWIELSVFQKGLGGCYPLSIDLLSISIGLSSAIPISGPRSGEGGLSRERLKGAGGTKLKPAGPLFYPRGLWDPIFLLLLRWVDDGTYPHCGIHYGHLFSKGISQQNSM